MARFKAKLTPSVVIAAVLVLGLLTAASAALIKGPSRESPEEGIGLEGQFDTDAVADAVGTNTSEAPPASGGPTAGPIGDMPRTLPMPPRDATGNPQPGVSSGQGVTQEQLSSLLIEVFGAAADTAATHQLVTRGDLALAVAQALGLTDAAAAHAPSELIYRDVPLEHEAFTAVALLERLGLYPFHVGTLFAPDDRVQWAEVKFTVDAAHTLESVEGPIVHVNAPARTISVEWTPRHAVSYTAGERTLIARNGETVGLERLRPADDVRVFANRDGELLIALAVGPEQTASGMSEELVTLVRELATPEQLAAIITRDWDRAAVELRGSIYNQLLDRGVTPEEAEALLAKDWSVVEERSKVRLTELISDSAAVNEELVRAILDRDWDAAVGFIEVEVLEYVLNYLVV